MLPDMESNYVKGASAGSKHRGEHTLALLCKDRAPSEAEEPSGENFRYDLFERVAAER